jgi:glycolate oxidase FAD binding subunit
MEEGTGQLLEWVRSAVSGRRALCIRAGGTKDFYGNAPRGERLDPRIACDVVAYDPSELVITARAGTLLTDIEALLASHGQMFSFEPPHFGSGATLGGCVAAGLSGPRSASTGAAARGTIRDSVLGVRFIDGRARLLRFGGTVIKNVAGYDISRVLAGSLGILGVIVELSLKVVPRARCEATLVFQCDEASALAHMTDWSREPLPMSASAWSAGKLIVRLSGSKAAVAAARVRLGGDELEAQAAARYWIALRDQQAPFFAGATPLWRLSLPSTARPLGTAEPQLIEWGGAIRWLRSDLPSAELRHRAASLGGCATLFRGGDRSQGVFPLLSPAAARIHASLKAEFDPFGIFNPGRLVTGL